MKTLQSGLLQGLLCVLGMVSCVAPTDADLLYFHQGGVLQGRITNDDGVGSVAFSLVGGGEIVVSREAIKEVLTEEPYAFHVRSGDYWLQRGKKDRAIQEYQKAAAMVPDNPVVLGRMERIELSQTISRCNEILEHARKLAEEKKYWQAIEQYDSLLTISPTPEMTETGKRLQAETYARLGYLYYNHVYDKGAMDALVKAEEIDSNCGLIYYVWGRIRRDEGNLEEAASHFQKAWSLDPKLSAAQDYLMDTQKEISRQKEEQARWLASE